MFKKFLFAFAVFTALFNARADMVWPTESDAFAKGAPYKDFIQPTRAGNPESGLFGDVRSNGYRFHEGIDIKPVRRSKKNEPLDEIYAAMSGVVRVVNTTAGYSGYGRYIVIVHDDLDVPVYTLYAHLGSIEKDIVPGTRVEAGRKLGIMGRSASYAIQTQQAHLHFEIGLRLSDSFDAWYKSKKFGSPNYFGNYNGMNLVGFDALGVYTAAKEGKLKNFKSYIQSLPTAYVVRVYTRKTPDLARFYPALVDNEGENVGWDIHFTWFGLPQKLERIKDPRSGAREGEVEVVMHNPDEMKRKCRCLVVVDSKGNVVITDDMKDQLKLIF